MASSGSGTIKLWTCSNCRRNQISMTIGDCPSCGHSRCFDCDVKSRVATEDELEEEASKFANATALRQSQIQGYTHSESSIQGGRRSPTTQTSRTTNPHVGDQQASTGSQVSSEPSASTYDGGGALPRLVQESELESHSIYVLFKDSDRFLLEAWQNALPELAKLRTEDSPWPPGFLKSVHLFRMGLTEATSIPTIIVYSIYTQDPGDFQLMLFNAIRDVMQVKDWQLVFKKSSLRKTVGSSSSPPPICRPRNREFTRLPASGASIGIRGSLEDTATLGCYLDIDGKTMVLTVDHLFPNNARTTICITHLSEQDRRDRIYEKLVAEFCDRNSIEAFCRNCSWCITNSSKLFGHDYITRGVIWEINHNLVLHEVKPEESCSAGNIFTQKVSYYTALYRAQTLGLGVQRSGRQAFSIDANTSREMDWAILEVVLSRVPKSLGSTLKSSSRISGGEYVRSFGRTSGLQIGQISNTPGLIFHEEGHVTEEWSVIKCPETPAEQWEEGGIGVEGDSGALIVDESNDLVYGMLWGRQGHGGSTITLFTPMTDIFNDIRHRTGAREIALIPGQTMARTSEMEQLYDTETINTMSAMLEEEKTELGNNHPATLYTSSKLAIVLARNRKFADAEKLYVLASKLWETLPGSKRFESLQCKYSFAEVLWQAGKYMEAFQIAQQGLRLASDAYNETGGGEFKLLQLSYRSLMTNISLSAIPGIIVGQGVEIMASGILELVEGRLEILGPYHSHTLYSAHLLRRVYGRHRQEEAQQILESLFKKYEVWGREAGSS